MCNAKTVLLLSGLGFLSACASHSRAPSGRSVTTQVNVPATPASVMRAFLDQDALAGWWKVTRSFVDERDGGNWVICWDEYGEDKTDHVWTGVIDSITAQRLVISNMAMVEAGRPIFAPLQLEIRCEPTAMGCQVTVIHRGYGEGEHWDWAHEAVVAGWQHVLQDLQDWFRSR